MLTLKSVFIFAVLGILFMIKNPFHKRGFLRAQGIITDYEKEQTETGFIYYARVKFPVGEEEIFFTDKKSLRKKPSLNKIVDVLYNPQDPQDAQIETNFVIIFPWLFILVAFIILVYNLMQVFIF
jgi:hypothetical protein